MPSNNTWPDELVAIARPLYESGEYSMAQLADEVAADAIRLTGRAKTPNAMIGAAHRRGWINPNPKKGGTKPGDKKQRPVLWRSAPRLAQPVELAPPPDFLGLTIQELGPSQCRYPTGDGPEFSFCGQPTVVRLYCAYHDRLCHEPSRARGQFVGRQKF